MIIIMTIFFGLMVPLLFAFANFDRLVKIEYRKYREEWIKDGKPRGFFWRPAESTWFDSSLARQTLSLKWLFNTPNWVTNDFQAKEILQKLRLYVLVFNVGIIFWAAVSMIITGKTIYQVAQPDGLQPPVSFTVDCQTD